jgi:phosphopentomutase
VRAVDLGVRRSFCDLGQTIALGLGLPPLRLGASFAQSILGTAAP